MLICEFWEAIEAMVKCLDVVGKVVESTRKTLQPQVQIRAWPCRIFLIRRPVIFENLWLMGLDRVRENARCILMKNHHDVVKSVLKTGCRPENTKSTSQVSRCAEYINRTSHRANKETDLYYSNHAAER
jgi:hypothetical protein